jgi:hypothetical protein
MATNYDDIENHHTVQYPWAILIFWNKGVAASAREEHDKVEVKVPGFSVSLHDFPSLKASDCRRLLDVLEQAYRLGQEAKMREVRNVLGVKQ